MNKTTSLLFFFFCVFLSQLFASIYSTQTIAKILDYQAALTGSLADWGYPHWYWPFSWWDWYQKYNDSTTQWLFSRYGTNPALISLLFFATISIVVIVRFKKEHITTHGSAHFATKEEIIEYSYIKDRRTIWEKILDKNFNRRKNDNDLFTGKGVFLGYLDDGTYLRDNSKTHILCCAPTRSGKGVGHIIPSLLAWEGSVIVTDIKGENWELTSGYRKSQLDNKVYMFKPTSTASCHYNPLDEIRIGTVYEMNDLQLITKILVDPTGKGGDGNNAHWVNNAWDLLQGVVLHLLYVKRFHNDGSEPRTANLSDVLDFLYDGQEGDSDTPSIFDEVNESLNKNNELRVISYETIENLEKKIKKIEVLSEEENLSAAFNAGYSFDDEYVDEDYFFPEGYSEDNIPSISKNLIESEIRKREAAKKEETPVIVNSELLKKTKNQDPNERMDAEKKKKLSDSAKEEADLSGLQKKLKRFIEDYNGTGNGYCHAPNDQHDLFEKLYPNKISRNGMHPHVRQLFQSMVDKPDKEFGSILSTLNTALILYRNPIIVENISKSDFVMKDLMDCKQPISLYLVFGPPEIDVLRPLLRVVVEMAWRLNTEEMQFTDGVAKAHDHRLLLLLDEFPALGKMDGFAISEGFIAGYGMKAMIITQDLNQINDIYGKDNYVVSNCQVQIYHTPSDNNSCKYLSDKLGNSTVLSTSSSRSSVLVPLPNSFNDSYTSRPLMYPDEVAHMDDSKLLVFCKGLSPIYCNKLRYFEDTIFGPRTKIKSPPCDRGVKPSERNWNIRDYVSLKDSKKHSS